MKSPLFLSLLLTIVNTTSCKNISGSGEYQAVEKAKKGYKLAVTFKNKPNHLLVLQEWKPKGLSFIDSARTSQNNVMTMSGQLQEGTICLLQFSGQGGIFLYLDNETDISLELNNANGQFVYSVEGKNADYTKSLQQAQNTFNYYYQRMYVIEQAYRSGRFTRDSMAKLQLQYQALQMEQQTALAQLLNNNEGNPAHYLIYRMTQSQDFGLLKLVNNKLKEFDEDSKYFIEINNEYNIRKVNEIGSPAQEMEIASLNYIGDSAVLGEKVKLSSLKGKVVLIDFWASWCGPCRRVIPENIAMYKKYKEQGFEVYAVSLDKHFSAWANSVKSYGMEWINVSELKQWRGEASRKYGVSGIPATFLLDRKGVIAAKNLHGPQLEQKIVELLAK